MANQSWAAGKVKGHVSLTHYLGNEMPLGVVYIVRFTLRLVQWNSHAGAKHDQDRLTLLKLNTY